MGKFKDYEALIGFYLKLLEEKSELLTQQVVSDQSGIIQPVVSKLVNKQFTNPKMIVNLFNYINQELTAIATEQMGQTETRINIRMDQPQRIRVNASETRS